MAEDMLAKGLKMRKATLGEKYVEEVFEKADDFSLPFQENMTAWCWGFGWGDETIDVKTRSLMNLTMIAALNRMEEFELHFKGAIKNGCSVAELRAAIHVIGIYAGVPAGVSCFRIARRILTEEGLI